MSLFTNKDITRKPTDDPGDSGKQELGADHETDISPFLFRDPSNKMKYCTLGNLPSRLQSPDSPDKSPMCTLGYFQEKIYNCHHTLLQYIEGNHVQPGYHFIGFDESTAIPSFYAVEFRYALSPPVQKKLVYMLKLLQSFQLSPPWTLQRICALLCAPRRYTDRIWEIITSITGLLRTSSTSPMHPYTKRKLPSALPLIYARVYKEPSSVYKRDHHLNPPSIPDPGLQSQSTLADQHSELNSTQLDRPSVLDDFHHFSESIIRDIGQDGDEDYQEKSSTLSVMSRKRSRQCDSILSPTTRSSIDEDDDDRLLMDSLLSTINPDKKKSLNRNEFAFSNALASLSNAYEDDNEETEQHTDSSIVNSKGPPILESDHGADMLHESNSAFVPALSKNAASLINQLLAPPKTPQSYSLPKSNIKTHQETKKTLSLGSKMSLRQVATGMSLREPVASLSFDASHDMEELDEVDVNIISNITKKGESLYLDIEK